MSAYSQALTYAIKKLTEFVRLSEDRENFVFLSDEFPAYEPQYDKYNPQQDTLGILPKSGEPWIDHVIPGAQELEVKNVSGFNMDKRSHRNDHLTKEEGVKKIPVYKLEVDLSKSDQIKEWVESDDDGCYGRGNVERAKACRFSDIETYCPSYNTKRSKGVTLGNLMHAFMTVKGSKTDFWYELFMRANATLEGKVLSVSLKFEHGS